MAIIVVDIECHDEENGFHTTYAVEKYRDCANRFEATLRRTLSDRAILHNINVNPGPGIGYRKFYHNIRGWYRMKDRPDVKVRYPRLGSFEVAVKVPSDFAPNAHIPESFLLWSKLKSRRWPNPESLAENLTSLLASGRFGDDVAKLKSDLISSQVLSSKFESTTHTPASSANVSIESLPRGGSLGMLRRRSTSEGALRRRRAQSQRRERATSPPGMSVSQLRQECGMEPPCTMLGAEHSHNGRPLKEAFNVLGAAAAVREQLAALAAATQLPAELAQLD